MYQAYIQQCITLKISSIFITLILGPNVTLSVPGFETEPCMKLKVKVRGKARCRSNICCSDQFWL